LRNRRQTDRQTGRRTDDTTISVEPIFLKMCSKNIFGCFQNFAVKTLPKYVKKDYFECLVLFSLKYLQKLTQQSET
jgi:hypothetical protein